MDVKCQVCKNGLLNSVQLVFHEDWLPNEPSFDPSYNSLMVILK